jgi:CheY-like chemotaxis protein
MTRKILMVDDEPDILKIVCLRLSKQGYDVVMASNGREALEKVQALMPDVILMDYRMPDQDGLEVAAMLRKDPVLRHIPIILMTASTETIDPMILEAVGVNEYLRKPFEADELMHTVARYMPS